jgi:Tol biopolymer transport system component
MDTSLKIRGFVLLLVVILICGCEVNQESTETPQDGQNRIRSLPSTADILFLSNRDTGNRTKEIYSMDVSGKNITRITHTNEHHFLMGIDNTGTYLVVTKADKDTAGPRGLGDEDRKRLWVYTLTTGKEQPLTDPDSMAEGDSFSPDSEWIVFWMIPQGEQTSDIYKIRRDGSALTRLTHTPAANEFDPCWSNDGENIVYNYYDTEIQRFILKVMDVDGQNERIVYDGGPGEATERFPPGNYDPSWSPDDQWIVFDRPMSYEEKNGKAGIWHILKVRSDGSGVVDLSIMGNHTDGCEYLPSYSPDGTVIVFSCRYGPTDPSHVSIDVFVMDQNSGSVTQLTDSQSHDDGAIWVKKPE